MPHSGTNVPKWGLFLSKIHEKKARNKSFNEAETLEKAMQFFWKKGFNATSMEDLVAAMGINRASLYDTFGDKKRLYMAALAQFSAKSALENGQAAARASGSPRRQIEAILQNSLTEALADPDQKGCMMANATAEMDILDGDLMRFAKKTFKTWKPSLPK